MQLTLNRNQLKTTLSFVSRAVPSRPSHPILANVLFELSGEDLYLTGFDLSTGIKSWLKVESGDSGSFTLPAKLLNEIIGKLSDESLTLKVGTEQSEEDSAITAEIVASSGNYKIRGMPADEYPEFPEVNSSSSLKLPVEAVIDGSNRTLFATSGEEAKQVLTGVRVINLPDKNLEFAATDGHRLSRTGFYPDSSSEEFRATIPAKCLQDISRVAKAQPEESLVKVESDEAQIACQFDNCKITSRLLDGDYPAYDQLIPESFSKSAIVERKQLLNALDLVSTLAEQKNNVVKFSFDSENQSLTLSCDAKEIGSGQQSIEASITGESLDIAFNSKYLVDGIKAMEAELVKIGLNDADKPTVLMPQGAFEMQYLVMPVQLRD